MFVKCRYILKRYPYLIAVSMVQSLERSPETREVVSSSFNSGFFFFFFFFGLLSLISLHVLMFNYFNIGK